MSFIPPAGGSLPHHRVGGEHDGKNMMGSYFSGSERDEEKERKESWPAKEVRGDIYTGWMKERHRQSKG